MNEEPTLEQLQSDLWQVTAERDYLLERLANQSGEPSLLALSEDPLRIFFERAGFGIMIFDLGSGRILEINQAYEQILGYPLAELRQTPFSQLSPPEDLARDFELFQEMLSGKRESYQLDKRFYRKDGRLIWCRFTAVLVRDAQGEPRIGMGQLQDITERKQVEEALRRSNALLRSTQEASLDGILLVDEHGVVISHNHRFLEMSDLPESWISMPRAERLLAFAERCESPERFLERMSEIEASPLAETREEVPMRNGRIMDRYSAPALSADGQNYGRVWYYRDITEGKRAEEAIRESEARLVEAQNIARLGRFDHDIARRQSIWTGEMYRIYGVEADGAPRTFDSFIGAVHADDRAQVIAACDLLEREHVPFSIDFRIVRPDGSQRMVHSRARLVFDDQGRPVKMVGTLQDITERKEMEEALRDQNERLKELDRLKSSFVDSVSHELRTPLTSIRGYAEFLEDGIGGELAGEQQRFVGQIQESAQRLERLVDDLLDFARLEAGTFKLSLQSADLASTIDEVIVSLQPQALEKRVRLEALEVERPLPLPMDPGRIEQVLINLVGNALKFTPPEGSIAIRAHREEGAVRVSVQDTGIGIAAEHLDRLFDRFFQVDPSSTRKVGGTGLGLSITKALIDAHGGAIEATSRLGEGSTFTITLPCPD